MPHLTLEYSANLRSNFKFDELFSRLHNVLAEVGGSRRGTAKAGRSSETSFSSGKETTRASCTSTSAFLKAERRS